MAKGKMPYAMGFQQNTQKHKENLDLSWSGAARAHASEIFFHDFSLLGDIWALFGDFGTLCVGFGVLFGGFGWPLGAQRLDHGPLPPDDRVRPGGE